MLTKRQIKEFQILYQKHFGEVLAEGQSLEEGTGLIRLVALITNIKIKK